VIEPEAIRHIDRRRARWSRRSRPNNRAPSGSLIATGRN